MSEYLIEIQVLSSDDFKELMTEMQVNHETIGHIQQETCEEEPQVVFYEGITDFPKEIIDEAIQNALDAHPTLQANNPDENI